MSHFWFAQTHEVLADAKRSEVNDLDSGPSAGLDGLRFSLACVSFVPLRRREKLSAKSPEYALNERKTIDGK